jgi:hypothetical protein
MRNFSLTCHAMISLRGLVGEFDLLHCHVDYLAFPFARLVRTPTLYQLGP